ncbi:MAG TPA: aspartate-semialdehyde dehydrogenase [Patescibacteria group bacterium]|nr:aspartate-semialdehyde dehydrogenase [Patescibacteria group bacterium]
MKQKKFRVGILGATGMVGQRFITLLENHPWFTVVCVAASPQSAGKKYTDAVKGRWKMQEKISSRVGDLILRAVVDDIDIICREVDFVFSALDMEKGDIKHLEESYASKNIPVVSNNSAHRWTDDVPMIIPEVNPDHVKLIDTQRKKRGWGKGMIAVKPNCSIQSYVAILTTLQKFQPKKVDVVSLQAISGAGKNFATWPEMVDNVIPFIGGEEEKSEKEPMKIWGMIQNEKIVSAKKPKISATCIRVPVSDGHMARVSVSFAKKPTKQQILQSIKDFDNPLTKLKLPSAPKQLITYFEEENRPQTGIDRDRENGFGITMGRLEEGTHFDWQFISLSHNTIRGAAGGAILMAELLVQKGYIR